MNTLQSSFQHMVIVLELIDCQIKYMVIMVDVVYYCYVSCVIVRARIYNHIPVLKCPLEIRHQLVIVACQYMPHSSLFHQLKYLEIYQKTAHIEPNLGCAENGCFLQFKVKVLKR